MTRDFSGKVALITGAASGIGRATAFALAQAGATLELADIDAAGVERSALLARHLGIRVKTHVVDVTSAPEMQALADDVHARHPALDILFNNAGVGCGGSFLETDLATWDWAHAINVKGVIHGCHFFVPRMAERRRGHVLNMASAAGLAAGRNMSVYASTKFAVVGLSESLRDELAVHDLIVTTVCPGLINTPITQNTRYVGGGPDAERTERFYRRRAYGPERVAEAVLGALRERRGGVLPVSPEAWVAHYGKRFAPAIIRRLLARELPE